MGKHLDNTDILNVSSIRKQWSDNSKKTPAITLLTGENLGKVYKLTNGIELLIGRDPENHIPIDVASFSRKHCILRMENNVVTIKDLNSTNHTFVNGKEVDTATLKNGDRVSFGDICVFKFSLLDKLDLEINTMLFKKATEDILTGVHNRTYFQESFKVEFMFHKRVNMPLSLIFYDFDNFKKINDTYGHICGDMVLKQVSGTVQKHIRKIDFLARYGGEEFVVLLKNTSYHDAMKIAKKLQQTIADEVISFETAQIKVTASFGVVTYQNNNFKSPEEMLVKVDAMAFRAKKEGKNKVVGFEAD